jgi:hypothetical protein
MTTSAHRRGWTFATVAMAGLALLAVGCGRSDSEPSATASETPTRSPASSASSTPEPASAAEKACRKREHSTVSRLQWPLMKTAWWVESGLAGRNNLSPRAFAQRFDIAWQHLTDRCSKPSPQATAFAAHVGRSVDPSLDGPGLDAVVASYSDWATATGQPHLGESLLKDRAACRHLIPNVNASYAVYWEPTARGKDYWVQLIVQNNTDTWLHGDIEGSLWVTDPLPGMGRAHTMHLGRRAYQWWWGGSSADFIGARPHARSTTFVGVGEYYKVHLGPDGTMFDVRPTIYFQGCSLPVHRSE